MTARHVASPPDARVVHQDVQPAEPIRGERHEALHLLVIADIAGDPRRLARAGRGQVRHRALTIGPRARRDDGVHPFGDEGAGYRPPDPLGAAGYHRHLPRQLIHLGSPNTIHPVL